MEGFTAPVASAQLDSNGPDLGPFSPPPRDLSNTALHCDKKYIKNPHLYNSELHVRSFQKFMLLLDLKHFTWLDMLHTDNNVCWQQLKGSVSRL